VTKVRAAVLPLGVNGTDGRGVSGARVQVGYRKWITEAVHKKESQTFCRFKRSKGAITTEKNKGGTNREVRNSSNQGKTHGSGGWTLTMAGAQESITNEKILARGEKVQCQVRREEESEST